MHLQNGPTALRLMAQTTDSSDGSLTGQRENVSLLAQDTGIPRVSSVVHTRPRTPLSGHERVPLFSTNAVPRPARRENEHNDGIGGSYDDSSCSDSAWAHPRHRALAASPASLACEPSFGRVVSTPVLASG